MNRPVIGLVGKQPIVSVSASVRVGGINVCSTAEQREVEVSALLSPTAPPAPLQCPQSNTIC